MLLGIALILAPLLYLLFWPTRVAPVAWVPPKAPSLESGPYQRNDKLRNLQRIGMIGAVGPEGINFDAEGNVYAGYLDGRVVRFSPDGTKHKVLGNTGGGHWAWHRCPMGVCSLPTQKKKAF
jgi:hypothetical protein